MANEIADAFASAWRNKVAPGSSEDEKPDKAAIRPIGALIQGVTDGLAAQIVQVAEGSSGAFIIKQTKAALDGDLLHIAGVWGKVVADSTPANNGYYLKSGGSGSGSWAFQGVDPAKLAADAAEGFKEDAEDAATAAAASAVEAAEVYAGVQGDRFIEETGASKSPTCYQTVSFISGSDYRLGILVAPGERTRVNLVVAGEFDTTFDLVNQSISGTAGGTITPQGNDEYICEVTATASVTASGNFQIRMYAETGGNPHTGDNTKGLFVQRAFVEKDGNPTNLLTSPADFSNAAWTKSHMTVDTDERLFGNIDARIASALAPPSGLTGKTWPALGDSITAAALYTAPLASLTGMVLTNLGVSGTTIAVNGAAVGSIQSQVPSIDTGAEVVTVLGGINDFGLNTPIGALGDTGTTSFYGALTTLVAAIKARAASARIVLITPYGGGPASNGLHTNYTWTNTVPARLWQYQRAVREVAEATGVFCVDAGQRAGIGYHTASIYMSDDLHVNALGGEKLAKFIATDLFAKVEAGMFV